MTLTIGGNPVGLPSGQTQGLGQFIRQWFAENFSGVLSTHKTAYTKYYQPIKEALEEIAQLLMDGDTEGASKQHRALRKKISVLTAVYEAFTSLDEPLTPPAELLSSSDSDLPYEKKMRQDMSSTAMKNLQLAVHEIKKIYCFLKHHYQEGESQSLADECQRLHKKGNLTSQNWRLIYDELVDYISDSLVEKGLPPQEEMLSKIHQQYRLYCEEEQRKEADRRADEQVRLRQEEARFRAEADRRAEEEARLRAEADRRAEEQARRAEEEARLRQEEARLRAEADRRSEESMAEATRLRAMLMAGERKQGGEFFSGQDEDRAEDRRGKKRGGDVHPGELKAKQPR